MDLSNTLWSVLILALYSLLVLCVPAAVLGKKLSNRRLCERFLIYVVFGNFYIINIVFILQLIHISNMFTLIVAYLCPILYAIIKPRRKELMRLYLRAQENVSRLLRGTLGIKTYIKQSFKAIRNFLGCQLKKLSVISNKENLEGVLLLALIILTGYMYGSNSIKNYGYLASDVAVHNYWINAMSDNNIFVAGVYPHGFHCVIYFLHGACGIQTSILLRLFSTTSAIFIHMVLFAFIKYLTKSRYAAYGALVIYVAVNFINSGCYSRFAADLPQEFGFIFLFPTLYFLFEYMKHERTKGKKDREYKRRKYFELTGAACSFSLAIAVHFYGAMIVGLFCVAIVIAYWMRFFRPSYFLRLMAALIAGVVIAVLPMAVSIAQGNHFQGSIGWGLNVIKGNSSQSSDTNTKSSTYDEDLKNAGLKEKNENGEIVIVPDNGTEDDSVDNKTEHAVENVEEIKKPTSAGKRLLDLAGKIFNRLNTMYKGFVINIRSAVIRSRAEIWANVMLVLVAVVTLTGTVMAVIDRKNYDSDIGNQYVSIALGVFFVGIILISSYAKLPSIMDLNRCRIYFMYSFTLILGIALDIIPAFMARFIKRRWIYNIPSLMISGVVVSFLISEYGIRPVAMNSHLTLLQTNGAVYCMYEIMDQHKDDNWTIVSPTDELRMMDGRGYHYEISDFIRKERRSSKFTIPTKYIYFFVEKKPLDYTVKGQYSGQEVSKEGASQPYSDYYSGNNMYKGDVRYILMSKMYYWAKRYQEVYPEDFTVFYEDEEFMCYRLVQNTSFLNNLIVDYGYND